MKLKELERACQRFSKIEPLPGPYEKLMAATGGCSGMSCDASRTRLRKSKEDYVRLQEFALEQLQELIADYAVQRVAPEELVACSERLNGTGEDG